MGTVPFVRSADNLELREFQQQLFGARIAELNGGLGILTRALDLHHRTNAKALMLDGHTLTEVRSGGICGHRTWWHGSADRTEIAT